MNPIEIFLEQTPSIEEKIGYRFTDRNLLLLAFVHRSFINEHRDLIEQHNERLEFLGDSVLGLLVAEFLYKECPTTPEGELSHIRSRIVQAQACAAFTQKLQVSESLLLGKGEQKGSRRGRDSIQADLFEAIIGAIFLDGGLSAARSFLFGRFTTEIQQLIAKPGRNWKAELQDYTQRHYQKTPDYLVISESGPDHDKSFVIHVTIGEEKMGLGTGNSKKQAQQAAAQDAMEKLGE